MGGCVTPAKPRFSTIKQVQIKEGSTVAPLSTSHLRYVNNPEGSLIAPGPMNSQVRGLGIDRPNSPGSSIYRPPSPMGMGMDGRPSVQSVLPIGSVGPIGSSGFPTQRPATLEYSPTLVTTPSITTRPGQTITRTDYTTVQQAQPFSLHPTSVPITNPNQAAVQIIQRTSTNIPLPGPPGSVLPYMDNRMTLNQPSIHTEQTRTETSSYRQDARPATPGPSGLINPPMMSTTMVNKTMQEVNVTNPYGNVQYNGMMPPSNIPPVIGINSNIPQGKPNSPYPYQNPNQNPNLMIPPNSLPRPISPINPTVSYIPSDPIKQSVLPIHSNQQPPRNFSPTPLPMRPGVPLQPTINFDRRLLNFDRAMFSTDSKTPQLNSFTYNLDLPISGENKVRLL